MSAADIRYELSQIADPDRARAMQRFFKTGLGEYGEGDVFIGISVPMQRQVAKKFQQAVNLQDISELLDDEEHEHRLTALFLLVAVFELRLRKKDPDAKACIDLYLRKLNRVNNWDLVDSSAHVLLGRWLLGKDHQLLIDLAKDENLWFNRVAMVSTWYFIRKGRIDPVFEIALLLLHHAHDLIHKAVGWMLREAWKKQKIPVETFLREHAEKMPRTMLRYAIEKMEDQQKQVFMQMGQFRSKRK
jgi:3-methyladenine DNA glycosylase AlkD